MRSIKAHLWWILGLLGLAALTLTLSLADFGAFDWAALLISVGLIAVLANSPIPVGSGEASMSHAVSLTVGMALGAEEAAISLALGLSIGELARGVWQAEPGPRVGLKRLRSLGLSFGQQVLSLLGGLSAYQLLGGGLLAQNPGMPATLPSLGLSLTFLLLFFALQWLGMLGRGPRRPRRAELVTFVVVVAALPVPYAILSAAAVAFLGQPALLVLGGVPAVISPIVRGLTLAEGDLKRRLDELSTLSEVSQAIRTSLQMESLLDAIYVQVAHLLKVKNFYIALHDPEHDLLTYPLAIREGRRQVWPSRPMGDRLTDRVIRTGEPLLISEDAPVVLRELGVPEIDNAPESWLGVPLFNPRGVIGCLGVFHLQKGRSLNLEDLQLVLTVAGQAAVAIENAMLYQQTERRAQALATLNAISASMSSTLDPDRTLSQVAEALIEVGGAKKAAIYLADESNQHLNLVKSTGLSPSFVQAVKELPVEAHPLSLAYRRREAIVRDDIGTAGLPADDQHLLAEENILASVDLPLETPAGPIGMASVYFGEERLIGQEHVELLETLVAHSALAVANARAHAETDQALRRQVEQLSRLESIGRELASTLEPNELFGSILEHALHATGADFAYLGITESEDGGFTVVSSRGSGSEDQPPPKGLIPEPGFLERTFRRGEVVRLADLDSIAEGAGPGPGLSKSAMIVPILRWSRGIGLITVASHSADAFNEEHERFMRQLAPHAAIAITNANLYQQLEGHLRELSLLYQASVQIATTLDVESVAMAVADGVAVALNADGASVSQWDAHHERLQTLATVANGKPAIPLPPRPVSESGAPSLKACLFEGKPVQLDARSVEFPGDRELLRALDGAQAWLALPLRVGAQPLGVVEVYRREAGQYDESEVRTAQTIASQAAIAIQNTELFRRIRESHDRLMAVLNSTREGMLMVNTDGLIVIVNERLASMTGIAQQNLLQVRLDDEGMAIGERLGYRPRELSQLIAALQTGMSLEGDVTTFSLELDEGSRVLQRLDQPVRDTDGDLIGWLIVLRDVTEQEELEATRQQLTEMIVHDLRSPLTTILGSLRLIERSSGKRSAQVLEQALSVARRSVQQMLGLVNSLLDIAKLESRELELELHAVDLTSLGKSIVKSFVPEANEHGIILQFEGQVEDVCVQADEEKLTRTLNNLMDNALKFTPAGGQITLSVDQGRRAAHMRVLDSGPGVPEEMRGRIFERFVQVPGAKGLRRGTGLGLTFAKLAVEAHGGKIWVEENPNGGSVFCIELPLEPTQEDGGRQTADGEP